MGIEWFRNSVIYQVLIDRFASFSSDRAIEWNKPEFLGGNIRGIIEKLDYIKELGADALWISPFCSTSAYHGYHITDFFDVDSRFGTLDDVRELVKEAHNRGMRIIADFVPNHCSSQHPFFLEAQKSRKSRFCRWFYFRRWPDNYLTFLDVKELPKLNLDHGPAREHIINSAKYWLSIGFDGFRLDHVIGPSHRFWREFRKEVKESFPNAVLIGEAWMEGIKSKDLKTLGLKSKYLKFISGTDGLLLSYTKELDGVLDFRFQKIMRELAATPCSARNIRHARLRLKRHFSKFPEDYLLASFLDNHDMDRFLFQCGNDKENLKMAAEIQFSLGQPAVIYYGTEVGMTQDYTMLSVPNGDLLARQPMKWNKEEQDAELLEFYKEVIRKRRERGKRPG